MNTLKKQNQNKTRLIMLLFIISSFISFSQSGIQFLGVKHIEIAAGGTVSVSIAQGKVYKIESVSMGSTGSSPAILLKNSSSQNIAFFSSPVNASSASYPYWLPSLFTGTFVNNNPNYRCSISITEYSVSP
jgi:hypothetical protein